jgi:hypothetical protein
MIPPVRVPEYTAFSACSEGESEAIRAQVPKSRNVAHYQSARMLHPISEAILLCIGGM